jgi:hypothetical protein
VPDFPLGEFYQKEKRNDMANAVSEEAKIATTRCWNDFQCLNDDGWKPCSISGRLGYFLEINKKPDRKYCNYLMPYGDGYYCLCPVRRELYNKYCI